MNRTLERESEGAGMIIKHINTKSCVTYEIGKSGVIKIEEHRPQSDGDRWYYDVYSNGGVLRLFDVDSVYYVNRKAREQE